MATSVFAATALNAQPLGTSSAGFENVTGASTPTEQQPVVAFDAAVSEYADFLCQMSEARAAAVLNVEFTWAPAVGAGASNVRWNAAFRRLQDGEAFGTSHTYTYNATSSAEPGTAKEIVVERLSFQNGADMDSVAAGDSFILRVFRDHDHADDAMAGDAWLIAIHGRED